MKAKPIKNNALSKDSGYVLSEQIGYLLRLANQRHLEIFHRHLPELTPTQFSLLATLFSRKEASQNELGRLIGIDAATTNGVVERLLKKGLINSRTDPDDKRRLRVSLTSTGKQVVEMSIPEAKHITSETLDPLTQRESQRLLQLLNKLLPEI